MEATTDSVGPVRLTGLASWLLAQVSTHAGRLVGDGFAEVGARGYHFRLLATLDEIGPVSQAVLARGSGIHPTDIVGALDELVGQRLVVRSTDPSDRRRNIITLTEAGRRRLAVLDAQINAVQDELLAPLPAADRENLRRILVRLLEHHNAQVAAAHG
jgi:DNA-binding MarR family transcriptional regulator